jgi:hypothetical protein
VARELGVGPGIHFGQHKTLEIRSDTESSPVWNRAHLSWKSSSDTAFCVVGAMSGEDNPR